MGMIDGLVQAVNGGGYVFGSVDGVASVQEAAEKLSKNPNDPGLQAAYSAAYWNAVAAETALIPGVGAVFASKAVQADLDNITANKITPLSSDGPGAYVSLLGNLAVLASQGVALGAAVSGSELTVPIAGAVFVADDFVNFASAIFTGTGVYIDKETINNYLAQGVEALGLAQSSDGSFNVFSPSDVSFSVDVVGNSLQSSFTTNTLTVQPGSTVYVPTVDAKRRFQNGPLGLLTFAASC